MSSFLAIDFETATPAADSACSLGLVRVENGVITEQQVHFIRPPSPQFMFTYIHGITWHQVKDAPHFGDLWPRISPLFEGIDFVAAHNASFDKRVLHACLERYGIRPPNKPFACSVVTARRAWKIFPTKLSDVCRALDIPLNHHEALSDALACAKIMIAAEQKRFEDSSSL